MAVVWTLAFAWAGGGLVSWRTLLLVALVTWCAYVTDRLLDARRELRECAHHKLQERHFFHWRHRGVLLPLVVIGAMIALGIFVLAAPAMPHEKDSLLAAAALAYFWGVHSERRPLFLRWPRSFPGKELLVSVLFTAGCAAAALEGASWLAAWVGVVGFAGLAWLNCSAIACWESGGVSTFVRVFALAMAGLEIVLSQFPVAANPRSAALLVAAGMSALLLALLDGVRARMTARALRAAADLALLTPVPLLILAWNLR